MRFDTYKAIDVRNVPNLEPDIVLEKLQAEYPEDNRSYENDGIIFFPASLLASHDNNKFSDVDLDKLKKVLVEGEQEEEVSDDFSDMIKMYITGGKLVSVGSKYQLTLDSYDE